jgi:hypothetical protein
VPLKKLFVMFGREQQAAEEPWLQYVHGTLKAANRQLNTPTYD